MSPETVYLNPVLTPIKVLFRSTPGSPSSPSTSQSPPFTPSSTAHIPLTNTLVSTIPITHVVPIVPVVPFIPVNPINPTNMANRYVPLQLPANATALPHDYQSKISYFDSTGPFTAIQHAKRMQDHFENYEIDDDSVRMRIFVRSLTGDVRT